MTTKIRISVLMPVYNGEKYLAKAIASILAQSYGQFELLIINDGSTDRSEEIIHSYTDKRIRYLKNDLNLGLIKTLNRGIALCTGEYVARMDADDVSLESRLEYQLDFLDKNPDCVLCGTDAKVINDEGEQIGKVRNFADDELLRIHLLFSIPFVHPSMMVRRDALLENNYDESFKHVEDYELWLRLGEKGKLANINKELLLYRWHDANVSVRHARYQSEMKDLIQMKLLSDMGIIEATEEDLYFHSLSFRLYELGRKKTVSIKNTNGLEAWFARLRKQNETYEQYSDSMFTAYLWARWIVLCKSQNAYWRMLFPSFVNYKWDILSNLYHILKELNKKE